MKTIQKIKNSSAELPYLARRSCRARPVGLVPTMGALHEGHASLVRRSVAENDVTVVSIFLNPTQFNDKKDLERYPRTLEADCRLLEQCGASIAFAPSVAEVYPEPDTRQFSYPPTDSVMEGAMRPGHFNGVCQVVSKLFSYVEPDRSYFGEKDYQQIAVIRRMVADLGFKLQIVPCPVVRERSGLAMSSRNTLLTPEERAMAANIYRVMKESRDFARHTRAADARVCGQTPSTPSRAWRCSTSASSMATPWPTSLPGTTLRASWAASPSSAAQNPIRLIDHIRYK